MENLQKGLCYQFLSSEIRASFTIMGDYLSEYIIRKIKDNEKRRDNLLLQKYLGLTDPRRKYGALDPHQACGKLSRYLMAKGFFSLPDAKAVRDRLAQILRKNNKKKTDKR